MTVVTRRLLRAMASEWAKLWSVRTTWWCLAATGALTVSVALLLAADTAVAMTNGRRPPGPFPASEGVVSATVFVQFALIAMAMLTVTSEYASGAIRGTLQATSVRGVVLAAKALVVAPVVFAAGAGFGSVATVVDYVVLSGETFGGHVTLDAGQAAADLLAVGGYFALLAVLTIGVAAAVRGAAATLTLVFMLVMGLPLTLAMSGGQAALDVSLRMPMFAGMAFMGSTENLTGAPMPYPAGEGLALLVAWTAAAVAAGYAVLRRRDA